MEADRGPATSWRGLWMRLPARVSSPLGVVLVIIGLVVTVGVTIIGLPLQYQLIFHSETVTGVVVSDVDCETSGGGTECKADVRYETADGAAYTTRMTVPDGAFQGSGVRVRYDKDDPANYTTGGQVDAVWRLVLVLALGPVAFGFLILRYVRPWVRNLRRRDAAVSAGQDPADSPPPS